MLGDFRDISGFSWLSRDFQEFQWILWDLIGSPAPSAAESYKTNAYVTEVPVRHRICTIPNLTLQ